MPSAHFPPNYACQITVAEERLMLSEKPLLLSMKTLEPIAGLLYITT